MSPSRMPSGSAARRARAEHILDATAQLLETHGYRRVTIDDIAVAAGIGKGTIYRHWPNRETLFWAALQRDTMRLLEIVVAELVEDAELALPHRLMRLFFVEVSARPLVRAVLLSDADVLGALAVEPSVAAMQGALAGAPDYVQLLADEGLLRSGQTPATAGHVLSSVLQGFFRTETAELGLPLRADLLAEVLRRSLEPDGPVPAEAVQRLCTEVTGLFRRILAVQRDQLESAY